jgi:hypothetical protein
MFGAIVAAAALLLVLAGIGKVKDPMPASQTLYAAGYPHRRTLVRSLGAVEVVAGASALVTAMPAAVTALGLLYVAFAVFIGSLLVRGTDVASCGCAGGRDIAPSWIHVGLNSLVSIAAALVALGYAPGLALFSSGFDGATVPTWIGVGAIAYVTHAAVAYMPSLALSRSPT